MSSARWLSRLRQRLKYRLNRWWCLSRRHCLKRSRYRPMRTWPRSRLRRCRCSRVCLRSSRRLPPLASLANRESAEALQKKLRSQGYNAYIRSADGKNRVFIGPLIERAEADRLRDLLGRQQNLNGFVVRFQPERG